VLFLQCVTGHRPDAAEASEMPSELPGEVRDMVARAVDRDPERRPATASDMRAALAERLVVRRPWRLRRGHRWIAAVVIACVAIAGAGIAVCDDTQCILTPRDGRWRGDPPAGTPWETELQRLDETHYSYKNVNHVDGRVVAGTLALERLSDGTTLLSGKIADLPTCPTCTTVGFIEFIILDDTHIYQNRSGWGPSHDNYKGWFPPYRYKWEGTLRDAAR